MKIANNAIDKFVKNIANEKIVGAVVYGKDASVIKSRFNAISKAIVSDLSDQFLVCDLSKERLSGDKGALADEFYAFSMFGGRKLIMIKDAETLAGAALKELLKEEESVKKSDNFILVQAGDLEPRNALRKLAESSDLLAALPCYEDSDVITKKLIEQQLKRNGMIPSYDLVAKLFDLLGKNRQIIALEIEKLGLYLNGEELNEEAIDAVIRPQSETVFEEFAANFAAKNFEKSAKNIDDLLENGFESIMAVRFLSNYVQKLYSAKISIEKKGVNFEDAVKEQRLFFKAQNDFKNHLRSSDLATLQRWLLEIQKLEIALKSNSNYSNQVLFFEFLKKSLTL